MTTDSSAALLAVLAGIKPAFAALLAFAALSADITARFRAGAARGFLLVIKAFLAFVTPFFAGLFVIPAFTVRPFGDVYIGTLGLRLYLTGERCFPPLTIYYKPKQFFFFILLYFYYLKKYLVYI
jgi:hypothetical protein